MFLLGVGTVLYVIGAFWFGFVCYMGTQSFLLAIVFGSGWPITVPFMWITTKVENWLWERKRR